MFLQFKRKPSESDNLVLNNGQSSVDLIQDTSGSGVPVSDETSSSPSSNTNVHSESFSFASPKFQPILHANQPTDTDAYGDKYLLTIGGKRRSFQAGRLIFLATWLKG